MRCAVNKANRGATYSRNRALALASAPLLLFLDADVRLRPDTIGLLLARLEREKADVVDGVYSPAALDPGLFSDYYALFVHHSFLLAGPVTRYNVFNAWCALCRADVMKAVGGHQEFPKGVEVENESLGRRIAARGYAIFLDPGIAVDHHWGGWRKLIFIFSRRVYWWVKIYFASGRRFEEALTTPGYAFGTAAFPLAAASLSLPALPGLGPAVPAGAALLFLAVFLSAYAPFFAYAYRERGGRFMCWCALAAGFFSCLACVSAAWSAVVELCRFAATGRTTIPRETFQ